MAGQGAEPGFDCIERFADRGEAAAVDDALGDAQVFIDRAWAP